MPQKVRQRRIAVGLFLIFLAFFLLFTYFSFFFSWQTDQSIWSDLSARDEVAENWMSKIGAYLGHILIYKGFGIACIIAFWLILITGLKVLLNIKMPLLNRWYWGTLQWCMYLLLLAFSLAKLPYLQGRQATNSTNGCKTIWAR